MVKQWFLIWNLVRFLGNLFCLVYSFLFLKYKLKYYINSCNFYHKTDFYKYNTYLQIFSDKLCCMYVYVFSLWKNARLKKNGADSYYLTVRAQLGPSAPYWPRFRKTRHSPFFSRSLHKSTTNNLEFKRLGTYFYYTECCHNPMSDGSSADKDAPSIRSWFDSDHAPVYLSNLCAYFDDYIIYLSFSWVFTLEYFE